MEHAEPFPELLQRVIRNTGRLAVVGIGDELNRSDCLGIFAAQVIDRQQIAGVKVFFAGTVPESITGPLRRYHPEQVLFLDAADAGARPGTLAVIDPRLIPAGLLSTHALPLAVVMDYVEQEIGTGVTLLGIQPDLTTPGNVLSEEDRAFLDQNLQALVHVLRDR